MTTNKMEKWICIDSERTTGLTKNKQYGGTAVKGPGVELDGLRLTNDEGNSKTYLKKRFMKLEEWREKQISKLDLD